MNIDHISGGGKRDAKFQGIDGIKAEKDYSCLIQRQYHGHHFETSCQTLKKSNSKYWGVRAVTGTFGFDPSQVLIICLKGLCQSYRSKSSVQYYFSLICLINWLLTLKAFWSHQYEATMKQSWKSMRAMTIALIVTTRKRIKTKNENFMWSSLHW